jgi:hypothetical protein
MSGTNYANNIWNTLQNLVTSIGVIAKQLSNGITTTNALTGYAVASLPATAATGALAWASNGRKPGEGSGSGTGVPVFYNPATATWFSFLSGAQVTD